MSENVFISAIVGKGTEGPLLRVYAVFQSDGLRVTIRHVRRAEPVVDVISTCSRKSTHLLVCALQAALRELDELPPDPEPTE